MRIIFLMLAVLFPLCNFGNVGVFRGNGAAIQMEKSAEIQMVSEEVIMRPLRGNYPINDSCRNLDPMEYHCTFVLRNLADREVEIQTGFPVSRDTVFFQPPEQINQTEIVSRFHFIAGTDRFTYPVRFVPWDKDKKFSNIFCWDMKFAPGETIQLTVCYTMGGYLGLGSTKKQPYDWKKKPQLPYLEYLSDMALAEGHTYVTETGNSWAGPIEHAIFRLYLDDFEQYLDLRGTMDLPKRDEGVKSERFLLLPFGQRIRILEPDNWQVKTDAKGRNKYLELEYAPFVPAPNPSGKTGISLSYIFTNIPKTAADFDILLAFVKAAMDKQYHQGQTLKQTAPERYQKHSDQYLPYSPQVERNLADAILEFYGVPTGNAAIRDFLEDQCFYPVTNPPPLDPGLRARLKTTHLLNNGCCSP